MSALFTPRANGIFKAVLVVLVGGAAGTVAALMTWARVPYGTQQQEQIQQPIVFDHRHHVQDDLIDCRYCHSTVESAPSAGIPATEVCLNCHSQVWNKSPKLEPVRRSYFTGQPIEWNRVHQLPDFTYFNHSIHVNKGIGCATCHGRIDQMPAVTKVATLQMSWCLDCHRNPAPNLRPRDQITNMAWQPPDDPVAAKRLREDARQVPHPLAPGLRDAPEPVRDQDDRDDDLPDDPQPGRSGEAVRAGGGHPPGPAADDRLAG